MHAGGNKQDECRQRKYRRVGAILVLYFGADGEGAGEAAVGGLYVFDTPQRRVVKARVVIDQVLHSRHNMYA